MRILAVLALALSTRAASAQLWSSSGAGKVTLTANDTLAGSPLWLNVQAIPGTATNDNAAAGKVGEYMSHVTLTAASLTLTTNTTATIDSLSLTAGDWDVTGAVNFTFAATTSFTNITGGLSTTRSTLPSADQLFDHETAAIVPTATKDPAWHLPLVRFSVASTTKVYLVVQGTFTVSTLKAYGSIRARRAR